MELETRPPEQPTPPTQDQEMHIFIHHTPVPSSYQKALTFLLVLFSFIFGCAVLLPTVIMALVVITPDPAGEGGLGLFIALPLSVGCLILSSLCVIGNLAVMRSGRFSYDSTVHYTAITLNAIVIVFSLMASFYGLHFLFTTMPF